ncbi:hypothetical protein [Gloeobacter kilaueensis]|uniref:Uncharacterized protein n=1 Tax=Gloeobacter kilaueensis (strain ATCC BAA-2537 / CCAP 1431/1 / ULC 316 / JS1) TaxID=1183438 RepID=U5QGM8_GLOK1|nr:hypothetical protein [Gloeobacter kilaueensis]AGY58086.1 hypothetical protein GKIL_1840 [Gloeobacter kilaueensis JS1]
MIHALIWLPLLALFGYLAWAGWNEYQKVQAYSQWAQDFDNAKYDLLAVAGRKDNRLVWGRPTRKGPIDLQSVSLQTVKDVSLYIDGRPISPETPPAKARQIALRLTLADPQRQISIPFTEAPLAARWCKLLQQNLVS